MAWGRPLFSRSCSRSLSRFLSCSLSLSRFLSCSLSLSRFLSCSRSLDSDRLLLRRNRGDGERRDLKGGLLCLLGLRDLLLLLAGSRSLLRSASRSRSLSLSLSLSRSRSLCLSLSLSLSLSLALSLSLSRSLSLLRSLRGERAGESLFGERARGGSCWYWRGGVRVTSSRPLVRGESGDAALLLPSLCPADGRWTSLSEPSPRPLLWAWAASLVGTVGE